MHFSGISVVIVYLYTFCWINFSCTEGVFLLFPAFLLAFEWYAFSKLQYSLAVIGKNLFKQSSSPYSFLMIHKLSGAWNKDSTNLLPICRLLCVWTRGGILFIRSGVINLWSYTMLTLTLLWDHVICATFVHLWKMYFCLNLLQTSLTCKVMKLHLTY